jgi:CheY-like chemotaxis protein
MPEGGIINVICENIFQTQEENFSTLPIGKFVKISIEDSGIGIPEKIIEKIFDPYFSTKHKGSGLGLAISQSIINKHGGHLSVKSNPGESTTFTICLPASERIKTDDLTTGVYDKTSMIKAKVLIMDDEEMVRNIAKAMLTRLGHDVFLSEDGEEAIALYQESITANKKFDLVFMDLTIPGGMGGEEAVKEILAIDTEAKVIVYSGYSNDPIMASYKDYGFCAAIAKPFQLQKLISVLNNVLN